MLIPLRTDAPLYHRPLATIGVIAANVAAFAWMLSVPRESIAPYILHYGEWAPYQWITSVFLHAGFLHLAGNMLFLWIFGTVVEGKVGAVRFLSIYAVIAIASGCVEQSVMMGGQGGSLGASGVIYGLMAISMIWAPENEAECIFLLGVWGRRIDVRLRTLVYLYLGLQVLDVLIGGFRTSAALHLVGAAAGLPIGIGMLKLGWVDCEGWDWFSRRDPPAPKVRSSRGPATVQSGWARPAVSAVWAKDEDRFIEFEEPARARVPGSGKR